MRTCPPCSQQWAYDLQDKKSEEYVPPAYRAFGGSGTSLGKAVAAPTAAVVRGSGKAVTVDESAPVATIQVKLCDGRREKVVLNLRHTVADLQEHVASYVLAIASSIRSNNVYLPSFMCRLQAERHHETLRINRRIPA